MTASQRFSYALSLNGAREFTVTREHRIRHCFAKPVIPVISDWSAGTAPLTPATCVILQGATVVELPELIAHFESAPLNNICLLAHVDLLSGLENNESGIEYLAQFSRVDGIVSVHAHLIGPAKKRGLLTVARVFLSDSRALDRGLKLLTKTAPDVIDLLPAAAAVSVADRFDNVTIPRIAGGLCRNEADVEAVIRCGCSAVTSTRPDLWRLNSPQHS